ncbi:MAG: M24 family metallopeptidase [bacterium]|nr:M24 family metallopeptidase [bacterium]
MNWTKKQINQHKQAAIALNKIIYEVAEYIKNNSETTDVAVRQFIKQQYKKYNLKSDKQSSIVAFGHDTANVHFYAETPRKLKQGDLIMVDIWGRLAEKGAPFADITWMMYYGGKIPYAYARAFKIVASARNRAVKFLEKNLKNKIVPAGSQIDAAARNYLERWGLVKYFLHTTGHSLGLTNPHGNRTRISRKGRQPLPLNVGYTIEPGVYFKNKFGIRSEMDFYLDKNYKLNLTTICQKQIIKIWKKN